MMVRISDFFKSYLKPLSITILTFIIFLTTQFILPLNLGGRVLHIYYVEIFILILTILALLDIVIHKKKINLKKSYYIPLIVFVIWFAFLTIYRFILFHDITGGFIIFRVLFFPWCLFLICKQYKLENKYLLLALILFMLFINFEQIYKLVFVNKSFRGLTALKNINIYLCFSSALTPILISSSNSYTTKDGKFYYFIKSVIFINLLLISIFSLLSGSRIGIIMFPLVFSGSYFLINKFSIKTILKYLGFVLVVSGLIFTIIHYSIFDSKKNIDRATESVNTIIIDKETDTDNDVEHSIKDTNNNTVVDSNNMRNLIWKNSINYILKSPFFGRTSVDIEFEMFYANLTTPVKMVQSPHNFILEMWLALGLPGLVIYMFMILFLLFKILKSNLKVSNKLNFMLSMFAIFGFSFFQPLVTCYFVISLLLWLILFIYIKEEAK